MDLAFVNPWWEDKQAIQMDKHLNELKNFKYVFNTPLLEKEFKPGNVYTIRGPRQIGKTTFLKQLIKRKLQTVKKEQILYWTCDNLTSKDDLLTLLKEYADFCNVQDAQPAYVLLDEITGVENWQKAIKFAIDTNLLPNACYILTGSNVIDLKKGTERLPGRRGKHGKDLFLMPLSFREYVHLIDPSWFKNHKDDTVKQIKYHSDRLKILFEKYLITGGIPLVINEYQKHNEIPSYIHSLYYSWIIGDVLKEGKTEQTFKEIIKSVLTCYTTPVSWDSLAKRSSVKSHVTISSYIELLSNLLVLFPCYFFNIGENKIDFNKNKKIYFFDPFIIRLFTEKLTIDVDKDAIIEGIVGSKIKRIDMFSNVFFTKVKKETDFVIDLKGNEKKGIEVKYQNTLSKQDFVNKRFFKKYIVLSKDVFDTDTIPVYVYLFANIW
ncbi:MAG: ATP-binding protein [Candidatus Thermoplasmatota archaeon]|nr:ATP-binding protein [Candidatus Thermoplasmatota archaeon]